jgi:hypothetical protein
VSRLALADALFSTSAMTGAPTIALIVSGPPVGALVGFAVTVALLVSAHVLADAVARERGAF